MATQTLYFTGLASWAKVWKPDTKFNPEGDYKITLSLDDEALKKFKESKMQLKINLGEDNVPNVTFKRRAKQLIKGELVDFGRPAVLDKDSEPLKEGTLIGNGSKVTLKVVVYDGAKGKGHRLEAVRVDDLVVYEQDTPDEGLPF